MTAVAFTIYLANVGIGLLAQFGSLRFGLWHHGLYALVFGTAAVAAWLDFHWGLLLTLSALLVFPLARPRTLPHPTLAAVGLMGYLFAILDIGV